MTVTMTLRPATATDHELLVEMLLAALNWDPRRPPLGRARVLATPEFAYYVADWPRGGELGVVAEADGTAVGVAWLRYADGSHRGYGYVADEIPELSIGVRSGYRGRGIGRALLRAVAARATTAGIRSISLSVERANPAARLYAREGYRVVTGDADADAMVVALG